MPFGARGSGSGHGRQRRHSRRFYPQTKAKTSSEPERDDKQRMDWLERQAVFDLFRGDGRPVILYAEYNRLEGRDIRAAIDAAMNAEEEQGDEGL